jgi:transposase
MSKEDGRRSSRIYPLELKQEAVQMLNDGHSATEIRRRLGLPRTNLIYRWKDEVSVTGVPKATPSATDLKIRELEAELHQVQRERDILKKALAILGRHEF